MAYTNFEENTLGFIDIFKYLQYLLSSKQSGITSEETLKFNSQFKDFNLDSLKNLSIGQIKSKIGQLKTIFTERNNSLETKQQKLIDVQIINNNQLEYYEEQLKKINSILENQNFINTIKLIQNRLKTNYELTEEDQIKYSFFKDLDNQAKYLENYKIGLKATFQVKQLSQKKNKSKYQKVMKKITEQTKQDIDLDIQLSNKQSIELEKVLSVWSDNQTRMIVAQLDKDFTKDMNKSKLNLKTKVIKSLMNFLDINFTQASVMMSDNKYRVKLFGNVNMEDIQNKINIINKELNEHSIVKQYLNISHRKISLCPFCSYNHEMIAITRIHMHEVHEKLLGKYQSAEPIPFYKPTMTSNGLVSTYSATTYKDEGDLYVDIKSKYFVPELKDEQIKFIVSGKISGLMTEKMVAVNGNKTFVKINKMVKTETVRQQLKKSLKETYKNLLTKKLVDDFEYKQIEQIIDMELKRISGEKMSDVNAVKNTIKIHISRMLISRYLNEENIYDPLANVSVLLEKIYGTKSEEKIVEYETLFNNIIHYNSAEPFVVLKKSFNNMINFLIELKSISVKKIVEKTENLLYKKLGSVAQLKPFKKKFKRDYERTTVYDNLNVMNLLLMVSYTDSGNIFASDLLEKISEKVELLENKISNKVWTWASKKNLRKIISELVNMEDNEFIKTIINEMMTVNNEEEVELSDAMIEMTTLVKSLNVKSLKRIQKQFNNLHDMFFRMYKTNTIPHDLNKMKSTKSFEDLKREYFLGLMTGLYMQSMTGLLDELSSKKMKTFIMNNFSILGMYLNEKSLYLLKPVEKKVLPVAELVEETDKDELLNDFFAETELDDDFKIDEDLEEVSEEVIVDVEDIQNIEDYEFDNEEEENNYPEEQYDSDVEELMNELF